MKTMSAPFSRLDMLSWSSRAAFSPISGMPLPRAAGELRADGKPGSPRLELCSACWSVLMATNETFFRSHRDHAIDGVAAAAAHADDLDRSGWCPSC